MTGSDFFKGNLEDMHCLFRESESDDWLECAVKPEFATVNLANTDKAVVRLIIENKEEMKKFERWTLRIVDRQRPDVFVDVECRWR